MTKDIQININDSKVNEYIKKLQDNGASLYIVGGYVRDFLLFNTYSQDIDIEVYNISFDKLQEILGYQGETQTNFGIVILKDTGVEFAIPRKENKIGIKHKDFEINLNPSMSLKEAAIRRDFTINSLMYDIKNKQIIDNYGGMVDLKKKNILHISSKFSEDPLRVLRALRFSFKLGFEIDPSTVLLCKNLLTDLQHISASRKDQELSKMFNVPFANFKIGMKYIEQILLPYFKLEGLKNVQQNPKYHKEGSVWEHTKQGMYLVNINKELYTQREYKILMYAIFFHDIGKLTTTNENLSAYGHENESKNMSKRILDDILINKKDKKLILELISDHMKMHNIYQLRAKKLLDLFIKYKDDIHLLVQLGVIDTCSRLERFNQKQIVDEYKTNIIKYDLLINIYKEVCEQKKIYNGHYFMNLGYKQEGIRNKQEEHLIRFINNKLKQ